MRNIFLYVCLLSGLSATGEEVTITHQCKPDGIQLYTSDSSDAFVWTYDFDSPTATPVTGEDANLESAKAKAVGLARIIFVQMRNKNPKWVGYSIQNIECRTKGVPDPSVYEFNLYSQKRTYARPQIPLLNDERLEAVKKDEARRS